MNAQAWFAVAWQYAVLIALLTAFLRLVFRPPTAATWEQFLNLFESKGGQLMLLWVTDFIVLAVIVHWWRQFDAQLQTTIVGLLVGINGAFLGAIGAKATSNGTPDKLTASFTKPPEGT